MDVEDLRKRAIERIRSETGEGYPIEVDEVVAYMIQIYAEEKGISFEEAMREVQKAIAEDYQRYMQSFK